MLRGQVSTCSNSRVHCIRCGYGAQRRWPVLEALQRPFACAPRGGGHGVSGHGYEAAGGGRVGDRA